MELRVGVVGAGGGRAGMARQFDAHEGARVTALCDVDEETLREVAAEFDDVTTYAEYETMLDAEPLDVVFVATPQSLHAPQAVAALERDLHVYSEVAAAESVEQARALVAAAEASDGRYMMGENTRYFRPHVLVERLVEAGLFGDLYYAEGAYLHDLTELTERTPWRRDELLGRPGITYPTHQIGPVLQWFGDDRIARVSCEGSGSRHRDPAGDAYEADTTAVMLCKTERDRLVKIRQDIISSRPPPKRLNQYQLQGTDGCFVTPSGRSPGDLEALPDMIWLRDRHETDDPHDREFADVESLSAFLPERYRDPPPEAASASHFGADYYLVADFVDSLLAGEPTPMDVHDAVDMTLPGLASRRSVEADGEWIEVPDSREW